MFRPFKGIMQEKSNYELKLCFIIFNYLLKRINTCTVMIFNSIKTNNEILQNINLINNKIIINMNHKYNYSLPITWKFFSVKLLL